MAESQKHGFTLQNILFKSIYGATDEELDPINYIAKMDLPAEYNRIDPGIPISCKSTANPKRVDMGDCRRVFDGISSGEPYHMTLIHYKQDKSANTKTILEIIEVDLAGMVTPLFGSLTRERITELDTLIKSSPRGRALTKAEKKEIKSLQKALNAESGAIKLAPKMDSKNQRRLQCSFNAFQAFITAHPERVIARGSPTDFRGKSMSTCVILSAPRVRKPK